MLGNGRKPFDAFLATIKKSLDGITMNRPGKAGNTLKTENSPGKDLYDRRRCRRVQVDHEVSFWTEGNEPQCAHLVNISRDGLFLETDAKLERGKVMKIKLPAMGAQRFPGITTGLVVRRNSKGVAIRWR
jgi:hypothetical protein